MLQISNLVLDSQQVFLTGITEYPIPLALSDESFCNLYHGNKCLVTA